MMESQSAAPKQLFIPFSDEEITDCQKVTPADLRILGRRDRGLMNNNFLRVYGVKNYGHLLMGKKKRRWKIHTGSSWEFMNGRKVLWQICSAFLILKSAQAPGKGGEGLDTGTGSLTHPSFENFS